MTKSELIQYFKDRIGPEAVITDPAVIAAEIYQLTGGDVPSGELQKLIDAVYGPDVLDCIEKLTVLLRAYFDKEGAAAEEAATAAEEAAASAAADAAKLPDLLGDDNALDILRLLAKPVYADVQGISFTWEGNTLVVDTGGAEITTSDIITKSRYNHNNEMPNGLSAGQTVHIIFRRWKNGTQLKDSNLRLNIVCYDAEQQKINGNSGVFFTQDGTYKIPDGTAGIWIRYYIKSGATIVDQTVDLKILTAATNAELEEAIGEINDGADELQDVFFSFANGSITPYNGEMATSGQYAPKQLISEQFRDLKSRYGLAVKEGYAACVFAYNNVDGDDGQENFAGLWHPEKLEYVTDSHVWPFRTYVGREAFSDKYRYRILIKRLDEADISTDENDCCHLFPDDSDIERVVYAGTNTLPGWIGTDGKPASSTVTRTQNVTHTRMLPVRQCRKYYVGWDSSWNLKIVGACYDAKHKLLKVIMFNDLTEEDYPNCDLTGLSHTSKKLYWFVTPEKCAYFSRNNTTNRYYSTLCSGPWHPFNTSDNIVIREGDPYYQRTRNKKLVMIGPSTLAIDGWLRNMVYAQSRDTFVAHVKGTFGYEGKFEYSSITGKWTADGNELNLEGLYFADGDGPVDGDWIQMKKSYLSGLQQYLLPWYKEVKAFAYQGRKTGHHNAEDNTAKGGWDYIVGDEVDLTEYDEMMLFLNTQQSVLSESYQSQYDPSHAYSAGNYVYKDGNVYKAKEATTGAWDSSKWDEQVYSESGSYAKNALVFYNNFMYQCNVDGGISGDGTFKRDHWDAVCPMGTADSSDVKTTVGASKDIVRYYIDSRGCRPAKVYIRLSRGNYKDSKTRRYCEEMEKFANANGYVISWGNRTGNLPDKAKLYDGTHSNYIGNREAGLAIRKELVGI